MSPSPAARRFVDWALRHGRALWIVALILAIPATMRTVSLYAHLKSDLEELLPRDAPSVVALDELRARSGGAQYLGVVVDAGSRDHVADAEHLLDDLAARVRTYPATLVSTVRTGDDEERAFFERTGPLYVDLPDLETIRARVRARKEFEVARAIGAQLDDDEPAPPLAFDDLRSKYDARYAGIGARARGRFTLVDKHLTVMLIELGRFSTGSGQAKALLERVQSDLASLGGTSHYAPGMRVGYAGDAAISVEELSALVSDLSVSSVVVLIAVAAAIILYYRWWRSVLIVVPPLLLATVYSFALASLPPFRITSLNSNTAFLGSIIVGNGINFGLILLARYVDERRAGGDVQGSLERGVMGARAGTLAAASAAAVSYAALALTQFRGFRQFGVIGGIGMVLSWVLAFVLMPSLIGALDRDERTRPKPVTERARALYWLTRGIARAPGWIAAALVVVTIGAFVEVSRFRASDIESDFSKLRRRDTWTSGEGYWGERMNDVLGRYLTPFVFLTDSKEDAERLATNLRGSIGAPAFAGHIASVRTIDDVLPSEQPAKLAVLADIRKDLTPRVRQALTDDQRRELDRFLGQPTLTALTVADLPHTVTLGLVERSGRVGELVLLFPTLHGGWWNAESIHTFVAALRDEARASVGPTRTPPRLAGALPLSSDILRAVAHDGPFASAVAFGGVVVVVLVLTRLRRATLYVLLSLVTGVAWLAAASRLFHVHVDFANFIAFPITFGIGVDYSVNVVSRYEQDGRLDILAAVRSTGAAVALCSLTTVIGYSSLLMAQNMALFRFGLLAVLGEIACLTVALVGLPAMILAIASPAPFLPKKLKSWTPIAHPTERSREV